MKFDPNNPDWGGRDRFLIGKGHACTALYSIFLDLGFITEESFKSYGTNGGLGGQLDLSIPGVEYNTGSLGHVLGISAGIALASKLDGDTYRAVALLGDGECYEGSIWEAIAFAGENQINGLIGIIDRNRLSVLDELDNQIFFKAFPQNAGSFGWEIDGHSFSEIKHAFESANLSDKPVMIVAHTIKGKGISFMENDLQGHQDIPSGVNLELARSELD